MTPADTDVEKAARKSDAVKAEAKQTTPLGRRSRRRVAPRAQAKGGRERRGFRWRPSDAGPEAMIAGVAAVGIVVAAIIGTQTDRVWPWILVALFVLAGAAALILHFARRSSQPQSVPDKTVAPEGPEERSRSEVAPFSVKTALHTRHQLRIVDRSQGHEQVVVPVSGGHRTQILIEGRSDEPVVLRDIRAVVSARRQPREGEPVVTTTGPLPRRHFDLALDDDPPRLVPADHPDEATPTFPVTVARDELELFVLAPHSEDHEVDWHLELDWTCDDRSGTLTVDLGEPFRVTPETGWTTFYPDGGPPVRTGWT